MLNIVLQITSDLCWH